MKTLDIKNLVLGKGHHETRERGVCAMEAVAWLAGEPHSDRPECACPVIGEFVRVINDRLPEDKRNRLLKPFLRALAASKSTKEVEVRRGFVAADYAVRTFARKALKRLGCTANAEKLAGLARIIDGETALAAREAAAAAAAAVAATSAAAYAYADEQDIKICSAEMLAVGVAS